MNEKEISEIKRTLSTDRNTINRVFGCYVNTTGEIIAEYELSTAMMTEDEFEKYLSIFRRTLSGKTEKNLVDMNFSTSQVTDGEEHKLLSELKSSELKNEEARKSLYSKITENLKMKENYIILLAFNSYDIPFKNGKEDSNEVYSFVVCSICPVKVSKAGLTYSPEKKAFVNFTGENTVSAPVLGFVFPAFDDRRTNIYSAVFYTKSTEDSYEELTNALFKTGMKMPAKAQGQTFRTVLAESLEGECSYDVARAVHYQICEKIEEHKTEKNEEPLAISKYQLREMLQNSGVKEEKLEAFTKEFNESFGETTDLVPRNIIEPKKFELKTPDVLIKVSPGHADLVETRIIDGVKCIVIKADDGVELNGLNVEIKEKEE